MTSLADGKRVSKTLSGRRYIWGGKCDAFPADKTQERIQ